MSQWRKTVAPPTAPITEAIRIIDASSKQICLVIDADDKLIGTVTDGDIRRGILRSTPLDAPLSQVMNSAPITAGPSDTADQMIAMMSARKIYQLPIVDTAGRVVGLAVLGELIEKSHQSANWVVLMAGGLGTRLRPLTENTPKPLLRVGEKPLLEIILENLIKQDFRHFYVSVNYRAEMIKEHLGDGSAWGVEIRYLDETERLGTAGPLSLIPEVPTEPLLVINGDLLTKVDFRRLLSYHKEYGALATLAVRDYEFQVPYGVVRVENNRIAAIDEKPLQHFFVNAGIYVLEPEMLSRIPRGTYLDMPDLFRNLVDEGKPATVFPVREYWLDIGRRDDFDRANREFLQEFADN